MSQVSFLHGSYTNVDDKTEDSDHVTVEGITDMADQKSSNMKDEASSKLWIESVLHALDNKELLKVLAKKYRKLGLRMKSAFWKPGVQVRSLRLLGLQLFRLLLPSQRRRQ